MRPLMSFHYIHTVIPRNPNVILRLDRGISRFKAKHPRGWAQVYASESTQEHITMSNPPMLSPFGYTTKSIYI